MIEYSKQIAERWNIPISVAETICTSFVKGDSPFYLNEYSVELISDTSSNILWEIFDYLKYLEDLSSKKKRVLNAYKKAKSLTDDIEKRINLTTNSFELDDLLTPVRPNARSRGQMALNKGLKPLAELVFAQNEEVKGVEELAEEFLKNNNKCDIDSVEKVIQGVKDIIAERVASDETVRAMAREFAFEDSYFEITPKNKKDPHFSTYLHKTVPVHEFSNEELLQCFSAEEKKTIRLKLGVQLFRITELLRHHVVSNPDATGFDIICEAIDDCWLRLLQPVMERDVKSRLRETAERWATRQLTLEFEKIFLKEVTQGPFLFVDASHKNKFQFLAVRSTGELLGTTSEKKSGEDKIVISERLKQFLNRYKSNDIIILDTPEAESAETLLTQVNTDSEESLGFIRVNPELIGKSSVSSWIKTEFDSLLEDSMKTLYSIALKYSKPLSLLPKVGLDFYTVHTLQNLISKESVLEIIDRIQLAARLKIGVSIKELSESPLAKIGVINEKQLAAIKKADAEGVITEKNDLLKIPEISDDVFRNIVGFLIIPGAENLLDRTVVHPDYYEWISDIAEQLNVSIESIATEPEYLHSYETDDIAKKLFIDQKLKNHIAAARRFVLQPFGKTRRKLKLSEVQEDTIVSGRVTNITQFGVFVNINAVCDGLIHISQLADEYVETPDQVVSVNDRVDVRILKVDVKKRRISLSMRNLGTMAPKVRPSKGQLDNLAEFYKNR